MKSAIEKDEVGCTPLLDLLLFKPGKTLDPAMLRPHWLNEPNSSGITPIKAAIMCRPLGDLQLLIDAGAEVTAEHAAFARQSYAHKHDIVSLIDSVAPVARASTPRP